MAEPKLRFKRDDGTEYPAWEEKRLEEIVEFLDEFRRPIESGNRVPGPYPYYGASGITDYVADYIFDEALILLSEDGANILDRNYRVCFIAKGKYWVNNHAHVLRANQDCVDIFVCEYLESLDYSRMNTGSAQPKLNQQTCRKIKVKKPCLEEQQKIAAFLIDLEGVISACESEITALERQKKGAMQKIFSQEIRFRRDDGTEYPAWEKKKVSMLCSVSTGKSNTQDKEDDGAFPFYVRSPIIERSNNYLYDEEAVITVGDGVGTGKVFHYVNGKYNLHQRCYRMYNFVGISGHFFFFIFSANFYRHVKSMSAKTSVDSVRMSMITDMELSVPCLEEQQKIADFLYSFDKTIILARQELEKWKLLKKGLIQKMFM